MLLASCESYLWDAAVFLLLAESLWVECALLSADIFSTFKKVSSCEWKNKVKNNTTTSEYPTHFRRILNQLSLWRVDSFPHLVLWSFLMSLFPFRCLWPFWVLLLLLKSSDVCLWRSFLCPFLPMAVNSSLMSNHFSDIQSICLQVRNYFIEVSSINDDPSCEACNDERVELWICGKCWQLRFATFSILHVQYSETPKTFRAIHSNLALSFQCCVTIPPQVKKQTNHV